MTSDLQVKLVKAACTEYLLSLDPPLQQLCQLVMLWDRLDGLTALKKTLQKLMRQPWTADVVHAVASVVKHLLRADERRLTAVK